MIGNWIRTASIAGTVGVFLVGVLMALASQCIDATKEGDQVEGKIVSPKENGTVEKDTPFEVRAKITNIPKGHKVYAFTEKNSLLWCKESPLVQFKKGGEWTTTFAEPSAGEFRLTLLVVPPEGVEILDKWFSDGKANGDWPGLKIEQIKGERVDSIKLKVK